MQAAASPLAIGGGCGSLRESGLSMLLGRTGFVIDSWDVPSAAHGIHRCDATAGAVGLLSRIECRT